MRGTFNFLDFLSNQERDAFNLLREKLGGKTIYIPYPEDDPYQKTLKKRNQAIRRMYRRLKKLGYSDRIAFTEITIRLASARNLSYSSIRAIVKGYQNKKQVKSPLT